MGADENRAGHVGEVSAFVEEINALNFSLYKKEHFNEAKVRIFYLFSDNRFHDDNLDVSLCDCMSDSQCIAMENI